MTQFYPDSGIHDTALYQRVAHPLRERDRQTDTALYQRVTLPLHLLSLLPYQSAYGIVSEGHTCIAFTRMPLYMYTYNNKYIYMYTYMRERDRQTDTALYQRATLPLHLLSLLPYQ